MNKYIHMCIIADILLIIIIITIIMAEKSRSLRTNELNNI